MPEINDVNRIADEKGGALSGDARSALRWKALVEMNQRSFSGTVVLALSFVFIGMSSDLADTNQALFVALFSLVALSISVRFAVMMLIKRGNETKHLAREGLFYFAVLSVAVTWSILTAIMLYFYGMSWAALIVVLFAAGMGAGALANFCIWLPLATHYVVILFTPSIAVSISIGNNESYVLAVGLSVYVVYLIIQARFWNREYWASRINNELLSIRAEELKKEREVSDAANKAKSEFLASMSHELRTPLNAIIGFSQVLETDPAYPLAEDQKESVGQIIKGGNHLLELINEILDLAKIESGSLSVFPEYLNPGLVLDECVSLATQMAVDKGIKFENQTVTKEFPLIMADITRLRQVLLNLISNAIKYNRENGSVTVTCELTGQDSLRFSVSDTGVGIPLDRQSELFQPFQRLGREGSNIDGTGIGLTITKELVKLMGGEIGFESIEGEGSTFYIDMPLAKPVPSQTPAKQAN